MAKIARFLPRLPLGGMLKENKVAGKQPQNHINILLYQMLLVLAWLFHF